MLYEFDPTGYGSLKIASEEGSAKAGGIVVEMTASGALNVGDAVLVSAANTVLKTVTTTDHKNRLGIVVGGYKTGMRAMAESAAVGFEAAATGQQVLVQISGIAWGVADEAILIMSKLKLGEATAGRLKDGTDTTDLAAGISGRIVGAALDAATNAGDKIRVLIDRG